MQWASLVVDESHRLKNCEPLCQVEPVLNPPKTLCNRLTDQKTAESALDQVDNSCVFSGPGVWELLKQADRDGTPSPQ